MLLKPSTENQNTTMLAPDRQTSKMALDGCLISELTVHHVYISSVATAALLHINLDF
jgi:hypothetical protein